jgi:hypothetical protein
MKNNRKLMAIVFSTFMCAVLVAHGYLSLTEYGKNLSNAQLIEELIEEEESETKDGKTEIEEIIKHLQSVKDFSIDLESTFQSTFSAFYENNVKSEYREIHNPPPDFKIS